MLLRYYVSGVYCSLLKMLLLIICILNILEYNKITVFCVKLGQIKQQLSEKSFESHKTIVDQYYAERQDWLTSNLGSIMYKNANRDLFVHPKRKRNHLVVVRQNGPFMTFRSVYEPNVTLEDCSVKNCEFTDEIDQIDNADAVVISIREGVSYIIPDILEVENRNPQQIWILFSDDSPMHAYSGVPIGPNLRQLSNIFNWTMTYRSDSDIPVPYGRTVHLSEPVDVHFSNAEAALQHLVPYWNEKQSTVLATTIISRCDIPHHLLFVSQLREHMMVDVEGLCFYGEKQMRCQHSLKSDLQPDCKNTEKYIFYLVFETASCRQYLTEKCFHNAYSKGAIPIIMGPPQKDCKKLLPPNSFLHVDNYKTPKDLVHHISEIAKDEANLLSFHTWRKHFAVVNEHGFFGTKSQHYCRVCEAMNYNDGEDKTYDMDDLSLFLDENIVCDKSYNGGNYPICRKKAYKK